MKTTKKIISVILSAIIALSWTVYTASAVDTDLVGLSARTGLLPIGSPDINENLTATADELPSKYDSRDYGYVLPVRIQQNNTCWAFGALSTMEILLIKNGEDVTTFSPQHANFWGTTRGDNTGWQRDEFKSGYSYIPLGYLTSWAGPVYEEDFPEGSNRDAYNSFTTSPEYVLTEAVFFNNYTDSDVIKELICTYGSVVGNFNADLRFLSNSDSFYCADHSFATSQLTGHCVSVIGWDDNYPKENFSDSLSGTPTKDGAWLMKNSWGTYNGDEGYFWISYEDVWVFDQKFGPSYAFTSYEKLTENNRIYQNEIDGATYECTYFTYENKNPYDTVTYMNVFDFDEENRTLDKVVFETTSMGADYKIYYIPVKNGTPLSDTGLWTELSAGTVDYTGYICADFENIEIPAGAGAIGVQIDNERTYLENKNTPGYKYIANSIGVTEWLNSGGKRIFTPQSDYGMSFYMQNGKVQDIMDFYQKTWGDPIGGTFVIKAFTKNDVIPTEPNTTDPEETTVPVATSDQTEPTSETQSTTASDPTEPTGTTSPTSTDPTETQSAPTQSTTQTTPTLLFEYILGDADASGKVNVKDATLIQKHAASIVTLKDSALLAADSDANEKINVVDATIVQKFSANIAINFPLGETFKVFA